MKSPIFVGVAGGTGSGKTTVSKNIQQMFEVGKAAILEQDSYYKDLSYMPYEESCKVNFDHPDIIDFDLLISDIKKLKLRQPVKKPVYDFSINARKNEWEIVEPTDIVIVEGILIFCIEELRKLLDIKIFVDTDADERLLRRIERDMSERGRTFESVKNQYLATVKPMYLEFVEPSKRYADVIIPRGGDNKIAINMVAAKLQSL